MDDNYHILGIIHAFDTLVPGVFLFFHTVFCATAATIVSGSTAVHSVGGCCTLIGAVIVGPRIVKYKILT